MSSKYVRRFKRLMRASDMKPFLKTGCDMGWYGHFVGPVPTPKIEKALKAIMAEWEKRDLCEEFGHRDHAIHAGNGYIWWKCSRCGRISQTDDMPITI